MNLITKQTQQQYNNSIIILPNEILKKIGYYLESNSIIQYSSTAKLLNNFKLTFILVPYKILYNFRKLYYKDDYNIIEWFRCNFNKELISFYNIIDYLKDIINILDKYKVTYTTPNSILYKEAIYNRHPTLNHPIPTLKDLKKNGIIKHPPSYPKKIKMKVHSIYRISQVTYTNLRRKHFSVLALMY